MPELIGAGDFLKLKLNIHLSLAVFFHLAKHWLTNIPSYKRSLYGLWEVTETSILRIAWDLKELCW